MPRHRTSILSIGFVLVFAVLSLAEEVKYKVFYQSKYSGAVRQSRVLYDTKQQAQAAINELLTVHAVSRAWMEKASVAGGREAAPFRVGDSVKVLWKGEWWNARVLKISGSQYYVTYPGYDSSWNEWVGTSRIRQR